MRLWFLGGFGGGAIVGALALTLPWSPPPIDYESVSGWPMRVYYRNLGNGPERLSAVGGMPGLSYDNPLSTEAIDEVFAALKPTPAPTLVKSGDFVWFEVADPGGLAWVESKTSGRTTYFYVFAIVEMPRWSIVKGKWVSELCLVARTKEAFKKCPVHNDVYAGS